jgi:hypothetical protein
MKHLTPEKMTPEKTKPPSKAVNQESQQSRACGARYLVVTFSRTNFWQTV